MTEVLEDALNLYLELGYTDIDAFWQMTPGEVLALIDASSKRIEHEQKKRTSEIKQQAILDRNLALQIGEIVGAMFSKEKRSLTPLSEYFPGLFSDDELGSREMSLEAYSALWEDYVFRYNNRNKNKLEGGGMNASERHNIEEAPSRVDGEQPAIADSDEASGDGNQECDR